MSNLNSIEHMKFTKSKILPVIGLLVLVFFMAMSYVNDSIFLDKIVICSFILGMVFFAKMRAESSKIETDTDHRTSANAA